MPDATRDILYLHDILYFRYILAASLYGTGGMPMFLSLAIKFVHFVR